MEARAVRGWRSLGVVFRVERRCISDALTPSYVRDLRSMLNLHALRSNVLIYEFMDIRKSSGVFSN